MDNLKSFLDQVTLGDVQTTEHVMIIPIFNKKPKAENYIGLTEAFKTNVLEIKDVSQDGSVNDVIAVNKGHVPILILESEQFKGAKQNRMINTTVLIPAQSELTIPVTCTEQGRWKYDSPIFEESNFMVHHSARKYHKNDMVDKATQPKFNYVSNQRAIWNDIGALENTKGAVSKTQALDDVYNADHKQYEKYANLKTIQDEQVGMAIYINEILIGIEYVSRPEVYKDIHEKLLKSFLIDIEAPKETGNVMYDDFLYEQIRRDIRSDNISDLRINPSVGLGTDYRWQGDDLSYNGIINQDLLHLSGV